MTRCIAMSSEGGLAAFRVWTAWRGASLRKFLALAAGSCRAAVCAVCASAIAPATRPRMVASCAWRRALACSGLFPLRRGIVLRGLQCAASGGGQGANRCKKVHVDPQEGRTRGACMAVPGDFRGLNAPVQCLLFRAPARAGRWLGPGARGHLGALRVPVGALWRGKGHRSTVPAEVAGLLEVGGR